MAVVLVNFGLIVVTPYFIYNIFFSMASEPVDGLNVLTQFFMMGVVLFQIAKIVGTTGKQIEEVVLELKARCQKC